MGKTHFISMDITHRGGALVRGHRRADGVLVVKDMKRWVFGKCRARKYKDNSVVSLSRPLVCYGGYGEPRCKYLAKCVKEQGGRMRKRRVVK